MKNIKRNVIIVIGLSIISKFMGFARDMTLSYYYGASDISDVFLISLTIPSVIFGFIGAGISSGYIPMYNSIVKDGGMQTGERYTNNLVNLLFVISTIITAAGLLFTKQIVLLFASGFSGNTLVLAIQFTRITLLSVYFTGVVYIYNSYLQIHDNYIVPSLVGLPLNTILIAAIIISYKHNALILPVGKVIAAISETIMVIIFMYKLGYRYELIFDFRDHNLKKMIYLSLPVIIGTSVNQINVLVDRTIASVIAVGGISALDYANRLNLFIQSIFVMSIVSVIFPQISNMAVNKDLDGLKKMLASAIGIINLFVTPAAIGAMIYAREIIMLLFGRGAFDGHAINLTTAALFYYSLGMIGLGLREVVSRAFFALHDTKTPMINAAISMVINVVLNIVLSKFMGIGGLALATSISAIVCTILLFISLKRKIGFFGMRKVMTSFLKILVSSLIMGLFARLCFNYISTYAGFAISLLISVIVGIFIYFVMVYILQVDVVVTFVNIPMASMFKTSCVRFKQVCSKYTDKLAKIIGIDFIISKKRLINNFKQKADYLYPGKYKIANSLTFIYHNDRLNKHRAYSMFGKSHLNPLEKLLLCFIKLCFFRSQIIIQNRENKMGGAVCYIGTNRTNGKIIDFDNSKSLSFYTDVDEYKEMASNYGITKEYLNMPKILDYSVQGLYIIEESVQSRPINTWSAGDYSSIMKDLQSSSYKYLKHTRALEAYTWLKPYTLINKNTRQDKICRYIEYNTDPYLLSMKFPFVRLHGDMCFSNILLDESNDIYYINLKSSGDLIFFYDVFYLMAEQAMKKDNFLYMGSYMKGEYDSFFTDMFKIFDLEYETRFRLDYLNIFFLNYWTKRRDGLSKIQRIRYSKKIQKITTTNK